MIVILNVTIFFVEVVEVNEVWMLEVCAQEEFVEIEMSSFLSILNWDN